MTSIDSSVGGYIAQQQLQMQLETTMLKKQMEAAELQGQAVLQLLESAASVPQAAAVDPTRIIDVHA